MTATRLETHQTLCSPSAFILDFGVGRGPDLMFGSWPVETLTFSSCFIAIGILLASSQPICALFRSCHLIRSELFVLDSCCSHRSCSTYGPLPFTFEPVWKRQLARPQPCIHYDLTAARPTLTTEVRCRFSIGPAHLRYKSIISPLRRAPLWPISGKRRGGAVIGDGTKANARETPRCFRSGAKRRSEAWMGWVRHTCARAVPI